MLFCTMSHINVVNGLLPCSLESKLGDSGHTSIHNESQVDMSKFYDERE
jgi:hypothetical protein